MGFLKEKLYLVWTWWNWQQSSGLLESESGQIHGDLSCKSHEPPSVETGAMLCLPQVLLSTSFWSFKCIVTVTATGSWFLLLLAFVPPPKKILLKHCSSAALLPLCPLLWPSSSSCRVLQQLQKLCWDLENRNQVSCSITASWWVVWLCEMVFYHFFCHKAALQRVPR